MYRLASVAVALLLTASATVSRTQAQIPLWRALKVGISLPKETPVAKRLARALKSAGVTKSEAMSQVTASDPGAAKNMGKRGHEAYRKQCEKAESRNSDACAAYWAEQNAAIELKKWAAGN
jgi:hypothetical protein